MMKRFLWLFAINHSYIKHMQLITTAIDIEIGSTQKWHKIFEFKRYAIYIKGSSDHEYRLAVRRKRGNSQIVSRTK